MNEQKQNTDQFSRRTFAKLGAYIAPVMMTLKAVPSFASYGSWTDDKHAAKDAEKALKDAIKDANKAARDAAKAWKQNGK